MMFRAVPPSGRLRAAASPLPRRLPGATVALALLLPRRLSGATVALALLLLGCSAKQGQPEGALRAPSRDERQASSAPPAGRVAAAPPPKTSSPTALLLAGLQGFCVHGGAPLVGVPLVDGEGRLYLVTQDGYLHSYESDGRFRFSYTVSGTPLGRPSLRASDGAVLLGTTARAVYGIGSQGQLFFRAHTVTPVWSGLHAQGTTSVVYVGLDRYLYALSYQGAALYRVAIPGQPVGEPVVGADGAVWVPLDTGLARFQQAFSVKRFPLPGPADELVLGGRGPLVLSGGVLYGFDAAGVAAGHGRAQALVSDGTSVLAFDDDGRGQWLPGGDPERGVPFATQALVPNGPGGLLEGRALVPLESGELAEFDLREPTRPLVRRVAVLAEPLTWAAFSPRRGRVLLASRSGQACLLEDPFTSARAAPSSR